jgi:ferredoxin-NADP reductase
MTEASPSQGATRSSLDLVVAARQRESRAVVSLVLRAAEGGPLPAFRAGQHLPLWLGLPGRNIATYTLSSPDHDLGQYRISIKLEPDGQGGSRHLHAAEVGTRLKASAPRGGFVLHSAPNPVVLLTGGIGITPALSMLHRLARDGQREVAFLHACNDAGDQCFAAEVAEVAAGQPQIRVVQAYANGSEADLAAGRCHHLGLIDRDLLRRVLPLDDHHVYLCGPSGFMAAQTAALRSLGVAEANIRTEVFAPPRSAPVVPAAAMPAPVTDGPAVRFVRSGKTATWTAGMPSLLDFAEAQGLVPEFSCRSGVCGTCACRLIDGAVDYDTDPLDPPAPGDILLCCARPRGPITLDL